MVNLNIRMISSLKHTFQIKTKKHSLLLDSIKIKKEKKDLENNLFVTKTVYEKNFLLPIGISRIFSRICFLIA